MISLLEKSIIIATKAHSGQFDKGGSPYILHPLRVMLSLDNDEDRIVGILHDVLEDTSITLQHLEDNGFLGETKILEALDSISRKSNESYEDFILRVKINPIALRVKLSDLKDNMNISRINNPTEKDFARIEKYKKAYKLLTD
ncbi:GTP pyrophosphokinase [Clostridium intestinale]|uniref:GTP pyrophosphokinase n=1 Tax=Clostridium intestinale TaxID=36845 RepID=A0A7D6VUC0_9CLOT|nr:GTP pyrophosphokinase [Clostridium intestinale]QLY82088.1 GTP pyrophosphokinase [Clostridium intestinale]